MIEDLLNELNPQQRQAVTVGPGRTLVLAGPGSGKTRVLTHRVAYLIAVEGVRPYNIMSVTFTNKAAREMQSRLEALLGEQVRELWLGTFHAMCARLLRREAEYLPVRSNFAIMDSDDQESVVKRAIRELNIDEKLYRPASIHAAISTLKNGLIFPEKFTPRTYREEIVARVYKRYQELLLASNALDFDDLLMYAVRLLEDNPTVCQRYSRRFQHILVDEFQDTNLAQYRMISLLSAENGNLFVVGDEDQSIYRWRGADYRNMLRFEEDYTGSTKILLEQNYRSTQNVLDAARAVIDRNQNRTPKRLFSERGQGDKITLYEAEDDLSEAIYVVDTIQKALGSKRCKGSDFAIMYRTNAQSRLLEEAFLRAKLPYRLVGAQRFYGRREVKDVIAYLRLVNNPADEISLGRVIGVPPRGIGDKTMLALQMAAKQASLSPGEVLIDMGTRGPESPHWALIGRAARALADFGALLAAWRMDMPNLTLLNLFDRILDDIGYAQYIEDNAEEGADRWDNVQELRRLAFEYQERGLDAFLENLALVSDQDTLPEGVDVPTLLTLHAAKGLEFNQVFIMGLDEGLLPHSRSIGEPEEMAEERRLFYVGLTRARNHLYITRAGTRSNYGKYEEGVPSRFLDDIPDELIQRQGTRRTGRTASLGSQGDSFSTRWETTPRFEAYRRPAAEVEPSAPQRRESPAPQPEPVRPKPAAPQKSQYRLGMTVRHPAWGDGVVVQSRLDDQDEVVEVMFQSVGYKRLLASLARLEIVSEG